MSHPKIFYLKYGETLLATLTSCRNHEDFWQICDFEPTQAYFEVKHFFFKQSEYENDEPYYAILGGEELDVILVNGDTGETSQNFIINFGENEAFIKYLDD